jgi:hypothetical protein
MIKIVALAMGGLVAAFGVAQVDFPAIGRQVAQKAAYLPSHDVPPVELTTLLRPGHR